ncbi:MAG: IPT/TIG domain-containing protein [Methylococcales bacterium]
MLKKFLFAGFAVLMVSAQAQQLLQYNLTVGNGSGSGVYAPSTEIHIFANPYEDADPNRYGEPLDPSAPLRVFDRWSGDIASLANPDEAHTTLIMPSADITVTAQYKDTPRWTPPRVVSYFPPGGHVGVIFLFHGRFGSATWTVQAPENSRFIADALARKYGIVVMSSYNRHDMRWDETLDAANNVDMQRVATVRRSLINDGSMAYNDPVFVLGLSNGGEFASLFNQTNQGILGFPVEAAAIYIASGKLEFIQQSNSTLPTIWVLAENDNPLYNERAQLGFGSLVTRGVPAQIWVNPPSPVYPERFWRIEGLNKVDSQNIYNSLKSANLLTSDDFLVVNPANVDWSQTIPSDYGLFIDDISEQLKVAFAEHWFMSDFDSHVLDFFDHPYTIFPTGPSISGLSPGNGVPGDSITINGKGLFSVSQVSFNGINASFQLVSSEKLTAVVPNGALTGPLSVLVNGKTVTSQDFVVSGPAITNLSQTVGMSGTFVTISGTGFVNVDSVTFNGLPAVISSVGKTWITAQAPQGVTTGPVAVTNYIGTAVSNIDFVVPVPVISSAVPNSGKPGTYVKINGNNLKDLQNVKFNGVSTPILFAAAKVVTVRVPNGASTGPVTVTSAAGSITSSFNFVVP